MRRSTILILGTVILIGVLSVSIYRVHDSSSKIPDRSNVEQEAIWNQLDLLTLNTFLRPPPFAERDKTQCRARELGKRLSGEDNDYDIVVFNETFYERDTKLLADKLEHQYPHQKLRRPRSSSVGINGGISLLSKYPIIDWSTRTFNQCSGTFSDCMATKGFIYALVKINKKLNLNVLATHMDAGASESDRDVRNKQLEQIQSFIRSKDSISRWPTVLMGDLNINSLKAKKRESSSPPEPTEYRRMLDTLDNICPGCSSDQIFSPVDVLKEYWGDWLSGKQGSEIANTSNCVGQSITDCKSPNKKENWHLRSRLDYIFHFGTPPGNPNLLVDVLSAVTRPFEDNACGTSYLSDHQGVASTLLIRWFSGNDKPGQIAQSSFY